MLYARVQRHKEQQKKLAYRKQSLFVYKIVKRIRKSKEQALSVLNELTLSVIQKYCTVFYRIEEYLIKTDSEKKLCDFGNVEIGGLYRE